MKFVTKKVYQLPITNAEWKMLMPLDIQMFADGDPEPPQPSTPPTNPTPPVDNGGGEPTPPPEKTFTQEDVNNLIKRESSKQQEKLLKELGISDFKDAKDGLSKFREWQESQKTEQEKQADRLKELETNHTATTEENTVLKAQISAMKAGVKAESVEDVVTLAKTLVNDETDMNAAIAKVVEKYPHFAQQEVAQQEEEPKPKFSQGQYGTQQTTEVDQWLNAFK